MIKQFKTYAKTLLAMFCVTSLLFVFPILCFAQDTTAGKLNIDTISAPSLGNCILNDATQQKIAVYLPPSYQAGTKEYPVVYYLPGWGNELKEFAETGRFQGYIFQKSMDSLINSGKVKDMIVVYVDTCNITLGSFNTNSSVTGNWEDYVTKDVIGYVDSHYRTIKAPEGRGLGGFSMGATGAIKLSAKHPELFNSVYAISPGLFDKNGLQESHMFNDETSIKNFIKVQSALEKMPLEAGRAKLVKKMNELTFAWPDIFSISYGVAFAPNPKKILPLDYPYKLQNNKLVRDEKIWKKWEDGFKSPVNDISLYKENLLKLNKITIEYGTKDDNTWIPKGCDYYIQQLKAQGIPCTLVTHDGGHEDHLAERLENAFYPFFSAEFYPASNSQTSK